VAQIPSGEMIEVPDRVRRGGLFGRVLQRTKSPLHTPRDAARRSLDLRYLHPVKHNCAACQGPATGGKDLLLLIVTLFGKRERFSVHSSTPRSVFFKK
jgi:hypothetical protein